MGPDDECVEVAAGIRADLIHEIGRVGIEKRLDASCDWSSLAIDADDNHTTAAVRQGKDVFERLAEGPAVRGIKGLLKLDASGLSTHGKRLLKSASASFARLGQFRRLCRLTDG